MWVEYNGNPVGNRTGDCSVRAVSVALGIDWETAYDLITEAGRQMGMMPSTNAVWGAVLRQNGFYRKAIPNYCPNCYTAEDFCEDNPNGVFVLGFDGHVATVIDGDLYDSWNSSQEIPQYYWYKKGGRRYGVE